MSGSVVEKARQVRSGTLSARLLVEQAFENMASSSEINAFISYDRDKALADARRIDRLVASGGNAGRLAGVPLAIKDNIDVEGFWTTAGTPGIDYMASKSAPIVSRLTSEGAIVIGKTNMHELAFGVTSNNAAFGAVRNPADLTRIPGGSSGGTAAAIASGIVLGGLGTDTAGSVRVPAALTGVAGFRPSTALINMRGIVPSVPTFDVAGPMATNVGDVAYLNSIMTHQPMPAPRDLRGVRLGLVKDYMLNLSPHVSRAVSDAFARIEQAGVTFVEVDISPISSASFEVGFSVGFYEMKSAMTAYLSQAQPNTTLQDMVAKIASKDVKDSYVNSVLGDGAPSETTYREAIARIDEIRRNYLRLFEDHNLDALIFPTAPLEAPPIEGSDEALFLNGEYVPILQVFMRNVAATGVYGAPGISVPLKALEGDHLPVGLELDGRPEADLDLLGIALGVEAALVSA
ncbi:amidase family protein [Ruegeria lacuscaerulensis]|uniref:amidase family protein n=1 Tax=Ruegeria lacuscaerulensis TaxID=55218 RepID=UPI00147E1798|nr:amidase family protein [Ruegeria lacuscaerulensis]